MPKFVDIGIFMIGRTQVDKAEVQRWLDFIGVKEFQIPEDGAVSNPALLIALAGKRCYKSFEIGMNPNISKIRKEYDAYFENILSSGHGSVLEHSVYNFAIENVSRVFTGEMNRHRAGWAISEGSMRFIRYSESIPLWCPESICGEDVMANYLGPQDTIDSLVKDAHEPAANKSRLDDFFEEFFETFRQIDKLLEFKKELTRRVFTVAFSNQEACYRILERIWAAELHKDSKFKAKKDITSMMRRIVGMGVATGGVWSGNIRGLRHVITMRAAPAAEEEILHVYTRVAKMMRDTEPLLFGDFELDENNFWRPKYVKV